MVGYMDRVDVLGAAWVTSPASAADLDELRGVVGAGRES
jgi:hypothetical protein